MRFSVQVPTGSSELDNAHGRFLCIQAVGLDLSTQHEKDHDPLHPMTQSDMQMLPFLAVSSGW